jgi:hypothetical protein
VAGRLSDERKAVASAAMKDTRLSDPPPSFSTLLDEPGITPAQVDDYVRYTEAKASITRSRQNLYAKRLKPPVKNHERHLRNLRKMLRMESGGRLLILSASMSIKRPMQKHLERWPIGWMPMFVFLILTPKSCGLMGAC